MKRILLLLPVLFILFLSACSDDGITPQERFDKYVSHWNSQEFKKMYDMSSKKSTDTYPAEKYVKRYKDIYGDLEIKNVKVTYDKLSEKQTEKAMENGKITIPFSVKMDSIAGPVKFDYKARLVQEGEDDKTNWYVNWNPGFIFPAIKNGGKIGLETEEARRGEILDRNRMPLAINDVVYEIGIIPGKLGSNPDQQKQQIANLLNMSVESINNKINADWVESGMFVPIKKVPTSNDSTLNQLFNLSSVVKRDVTGRVYPYGKATAHLVGYVGKITAEELENLDSKIYGPNDVIGKRGLEQRFDKQLQGEDGVKITVTKENGETNVIAEKPVKDGKNIVTTIDADLQQRIFKSYDGEAGTAAAIDPKTGETLALVSSPSFNPNDFLYGISQSKLEELQNNPKKPLINRFAATFTPGSSIKPVTAAIGLNNGTIKPGEGVEINGLTWSGGENWGDYKVRRVSTSSQPVDVTDALIRSDNIYFAMQAVNMGADKYVKGLKQFGFGKEFPFKYPIQTSTVSTSGNINDEVLLANSSYGQGELQISALHLAMTYTPILNKGNMLKPTLLIDEKDGEVWKKNLITDKQADLLQDALRKVVASPKGTANGAQRADFPISGKTGTAELKKTLDEKSGAENGWFVGYPSKSKDILISMMVEHTEDNGGSSYVVDKVTNVLMDVK
ncbi:penicillin-binding transpeptidase domain-containing protein [Virgibacillus siamensis]|uniref:penicillin-binding transpeptidase domain-containing protein n=1 Tax=Virgibacillus siamensis TaxID=480071 RepID=UPI0009862CD7|nr:penicillin-binding transpeptidase domain-containing protein [Virgibacillus siamensis]